MIQTAIARGWIEGPEHAGKRARLVDALVKPAEDPTSTDRDKLQAWRLVTCSMSLANLRTFKCSLPKLKRE